MPTCWLKEADFVVIMFGLNDSWVDEGRTESRLSVRQYRDNLLKMLTTLHSGDRRGIDDSQSSHRTHLFRAIATSL